MNLAEGDYSYFSFSRHVASQDGIRGWTHQGEVRCRRDRARGGTAKVREEGVGSEGEEIYGCGAREGEISQHTREEDAEDEG